jgi:uncharacterized membrane protein YagU involved in acid resistance
MMEFALVKNRRGKRVVCWKPFLTLTLILLLIPAVLSSGIYVLVVKRWNPLALYGGLAAGASTAIITLIFALATPLYKLPHDNNKKNP